MERLTEEMYQYDAFISYRHTEPDITIAKKLMEMLEGYRLPRNISKKYGAQSIKRVFRDREELPTTADLSVSIKDALKSSRFLIIICSPRTPYSEWVNKEIELFKEIHGIHKIQALLIEGEPKESFPQSLQKEITKITQADGSITEQVKDLELLAADMRPDELKGRNRSAYGSSEKDDRMLLSKSLKLLKTEILRCLAPMFNCKFDELYRRHLKRRFRNFSLIAASAMALMGSLAIYTVNMSREIANQRDSALISQSLFLSDLSEQQFSKGDRVVAAMLALEALPKDLKQPDRPYVLDAEAALYNATNICADKYIPYTILKHDSHINSANFNFDNSKIVTASDDRTATVWDAKTGRQITRLKGHTEGLYYAEFSPDGRKVVTSSADKTAIIWDAETGEKLCVLEGHKKALTRAMFNHDGSKVVEAWFDDCAIIWDAASGEILHILQNGASQFFSAQFSPDGSKVVTTDNSSAIIIWDTETGERALQVDFPKEHTKSGAEFSPDGALVVAKDISAKKDSAEVVIINANTGELLHTLDSHRFNLIGASFSKDGTKIITSADDNKIIVWDTATGKAIKQMENNELDLVSACFSPDGKSIVSTHEDLDPKMMTKITILWDSKTFVETARLIHQNDFNIFHSKFSSDGNILVTANDYRSLMLWYTNGDKDAVRLTGHSGYIRSIEYSSDGQHLLTTASDKKAIIWDISNGGILEELSFADYAGFNAALSPDGTKAAVCSGDGTAIIWDLAADKEISRLSGRKVVRYVAFSSDSKRIMTLSDGDLFSGHDIIVWDASTGAEVARCKSSYYIFHAEFSFDCSKILTVPYRKSHSFLEIWDVATGAKIAQFTEVKSENTVISPDGKMLGTMLFDNTTVIWDTATGEKLSELSGYSEYDGYITGRAFSPDNMQFLTVPTAKIPVIWDPKTGKEVFRLQGHNDRISIARYSPDGSMIVTASEDGAAIIWDAVTGKKIILLQGHNEPVVDAKFSPDGKMAITIHKDSTSSLWKIENGIEVARLQGINAIFSHDVKKIATSLDDGTIIIWPIKQYSDILTCARNITEGRKFTEQEKEEFFLK